MEITGDEKVVDNPGVFTVWDRRINSCLFDENTSLYALLRAYVQDDPERPLYDAVRQYLPPTMCH